MRAFFSVLAIVLSVGFILASMSNTVRPYKRVPDSALRAETTRLASEIDTLKLNLATGKGSMDECAANLKNRSSEAAAVDAEIKLRGFHADELSVIFLIAGILGLFVGKIMHLFKVSPRTRDSIIADLDIAEGPPKEVYLEEWEFNQRVEGGFKTKRDAILWLKSDPSLNCDYCSSRLRSTMTGYKESVELVTFYKKVPDGAKDLRVVLGSFWFANPASELKCPSCGRTIKR